jgi:NAD-dependent dihydropyrimidine dehydrogenase PreA subunit
MATQFVIGIYEYQLNKLTPELARDLEEYLAHWWNADTWRKAPQIRTIPVGESISPQLEVLAYEQAEALVGAQERFAVAPCICRQEKRMLGEGCDKPLETCLSFGDAADFYVHNGWGRAISRDEALALLKADEAAGLVLQPGNSQQADFICACCGCCCGVLRGLKLDPKPARIASSAFHALLDRDLCSGCGACTERCQMEAIRLDDGHALLDLDRCIGCGLCVSTCPTEALSLVRKPTFEQPYVPKNIVETNIKLGQARGVLRTPDLIGLMVRSKVDRLLAPK